MIARVALLLMAGAFEGTSPAIAIDPCVAVDAEEVRRLAELELSDWKGRTPLSALEVTVTCQNGAQEVRVSDRAHGRTTVRSIDLASPTEGEGEAKARELALAIAELLRRADTEPAPQAAPPPPAPVVSPPPDPAPPSPVDVRPWRAELGASGVGAAWTSGEALFGADLTGRFRIAGPVLADLRLGGRRTRRLDVGEGVVNGHGIAAGTGIAFDAAPLARGVGVSFGARLTVDWLRYAAVGGSGTVGGGDAVAVAAAGTTTAFVVLRRPLCLVIDAAVGGALHSVAVSMNDDQISGLGGVLLSTSLGLTGQF